MARPVAWLVRLDRRVQAPPVSDPPEPPVEFSRTDWGFGRGVRHDLG